MATISGINENRARKDVLSKPDKNIIDQIDPNRVGRIAKTAEELVYESRNVTLLRFDKAFLQSQDGVKAEAIFNRLSLTFGEIIFATAGNEDHTLLASFEREIIEEWAKEFYGIYYWCGGKIPNIGLTEFESKVLGLKLMACVRALLIQDQKIDTEGAEDYIPTRFYDINQEFFSSLWGEFMAMYNNPEIKYPDAEYSFRDYVNGYKESLSEIIAKLKIKIIDFEKNKLNLPEILSEEQLQTLQTCVGIEMLRQTPGVETDNLPIINSDKAATITDPAVREQLRKLRGRQVVYEEIITLHPEPLINNNDVRIFSNILLKKVIQLSENQLPSINLNIPVKNYSFTEVVSGVLSDQSATFYYALIELFPLQKEEEYNLEKDEKGDFTKFKKIQKLIIQNLWNKDYINAFLIKNTTSFNRDTTADSVIAFLNRNKWLELDVPSVD